MSARAVVVNDARLLPAAAALTLASAEHDTELLIAERHLDTRDYGGLDDPELVRAIVSALRRALPGRVHTVPAIPRSDAPADTTGVFSSLYTCTHDSEADALRYPELFAGLVESHRGAEDLADAVASGGYEHVEVFNGRLASCYALVERCRTLSVPLGFYEYPRAPLRSRFRLEFIRTPFPIHALGEWGRRIDEALLAGGAAASGAEIDAYVEAKLGNRFTQAYRSAPERQVDAVIFLSSSHEYRSLGPEIAGDLGTLDELSFVRQAVADLEPGARCAVRCHPNQRLDPSRERVLAPLAAWCAAEGVDFYGPDSDVSSYALIDRADLVVVDLSSIAVDALLKGRAIRVYGHPAWRSTYDRLTASGVEGDALARGVAEAMVVADRFYQQPLSRSAATWFWSQRLRLGARARGASPLESAGAVEQVAT